MTRKKNCQVSAKKKKKGGEAKKGNSIIRFVLINIQRGTELIFCIIKHAMYFITELRNVQRS